MLREFAKYLRLVRKCELTYSSLKTEWFLCAMFLILSFFYQVEFFEYITNFMVNLSIAAV